MGNEVQPLPVQLPFEVIAHILFFLAPPTWDTQHVYDSSATNTSALWNAELEHQQHLCMNDLAIAARICRGLLPIVRRLMYSRMTIASPRTARKLAQKLRSEREEELQMSIDLHTTPHFPPLSPSWYKHCDDWLSPTTEATELCSDTSSASTLPIDCPSAPLDSPPTPTDFDQLISPLLEDTLYDGLSMTSCVSCTRCTTSISHYSVDEATPPIEQLRLGDTIKELRFPHSDGIIGPMEADEDVGQWRCSIRTIFDFCPKVDSVTVVVPPEGGVVLEELMGITTRASLKRFEVLCTRPSTYPTYRIAPPTQLLSNLSCLHLHNLQPTVRFFTYLLATKVHNDREPLLLQTLTLSGLHGSIDLPDPSGHLMALQCLLLSQSDDQSRNYGNATVHWDVSGGTLVLTNADGITSLTTNATTFDTGSCGSIGPDPYDRQRWPLACKIPL